jgi:ankyrin repeat protein
MFKRGTAMSEQRSAEEIEGFFEDILRCRLQMVEWGLKRGLSPNVRDETGKSALTAAAEACFIDAAKLLIAAGANVNHRDVTSNGFHNDVTTALHTAISKRNLDMVDLLLSNKADPRIPDRDGRNAVHEFFFSKLLDPERKRTDVEQALSLLRRIVTPDFPLNKMGTQGATALHLALLGSPPPEAIDILLANGADPDIMSSSGTRAIHRPWTSANFWALEKLLESGADINSPDRNGLTALAYAGDVETVDAMIGLGADIHHVDDIGRNTLAFLIDTSKDQKTDRNVAIRLIGAGIDTGAPDFTGASVESRLAEMTSASNGPEFTPAQRDYASALQAALFANRARSVIALAARAPHPRPA